jgi:hypothetical protein
MAATGECWFVRKSVPPKIVREDTKKLALSQEKGKNCTLLKVLFLGLLACLTGVKRLLYRFL